MNTFADWAHARLDLSSVRADGEAEIACPYCGREKKAWLNLQTGRGICFRCGSRWGAVELVSHVDGVPPMQARAMLRTGAALPVRMSDRRSAGVAAPVSTSIWPECSAPVLNAPNGLSDLALSYLERRNVTPEMAARYNLRVAWAGTYAYRILCPFSLLDGTPVSFGARLIDGLGSGPKMLYPPGSRAGTFFGRLSGTTVILVEGPFDALSVGAQALALGGKTAHRTQILALRRARVADVLVLLDSDAGAAIIELAAQLLRHPWRVWLGSLPVGRKDPGEASKSELQAVYAAARPATVELLSTGYKKVLGDHYTAGQ